MYLVHYNFVLYVLGTVGVLQRVQRLHEVSVGRTHTRHHQGLRVATLGICMFLLNGAEKIEILETQ